jgi:micrococcal nuclease
VLIAAVVAVTTYGSPAAAQPAVSAPGSAVTYGTGPIVQDGTVVYVADGDTIDVKIDGVPADPGRNGTRIRFLGINAMELYTYHQNLDLVTGECHAVEAAKLLKSLLTTPTGAGARVRLTAQDASTRNGSRLARYVAVQEADGSWSDVGSTMLKDGAALADDEPVNYQWNARYRQFAETAAAQGTGIWDTGYCGPGPRADLSVRVTWDAPGNDTTNVDGEFVKITNHGSTTVDLAGWWVRDSGGRTMPTVLETKRGYILPKGAIVRPGASIRVHVGKGTTSRAAGRYYYGLRSPIFDNVTGFPTYLGDGAYLFDPRGNLRHWQQYPCVSTLPHACVG